MRLSFSALAAARRSASAARSAAAPMVPRRSPCSVRAITLGRRRPRVPPRTRASACCFRLVSPHRAAPELVRHGLLHRERRVAVPAHPRTISNARGKRRGKRGAALRQPRAPPSAAGRIGSARRPRRAPLDAPRERVREHAPHSPLAAARPKHTIATSTETAANTTAQLVANAIVSRSAVAGTPSTARSSKATRRETGGGESSSCAFRGSRARHVPTMFLYDHGSAVPAPARGTRASRGASAHEKAHRLSVKI